ncbi:hypothetical protein IFT67_10305 [Sphingomonas sp. CFBP 13728]|uniref:hypothetical protein n=1 Tax=Sphingomonas sp. CFBP 13728 TaxID=2775294 RepID=UPI00177B8756|nr:hypothetical protein [Sphingomonas sp. CFBP 13728]MBD8619311.1 hypothetical protein [Sphingomonas sp. CFBP 13728]
MALPQMQGAMSSSFVAQEPPQGVLSRKKFKPFDKDNRSKTLLAIGTGLLANPMSFAAGIGAAGENVGKLRDTYDDLQRPDKSTIGGPDNAFQITTDRETGEQTFKPIPAMTDYLGKKAAALKAPKAPTAAETITQRGNLMGAVLKVAPENQAQAYADFRADSERLGYDLGLPPQWDPQVATAMANQTITPADTMRDERATTARTAAQGNADRSYGLRVKSDDRAERGYGLKVLAGALAERKYKSPPSTRKAAPSQQRLPAGAVLVN